MLPEGNGDDHYHAAINTVMCNRSLPVEYTGTNITGERNHLLIVF